MATGATCTIIFQDGSTVTPDSFENYVITLESDAPDIPTESATVNTNIIKKPRKCSVDLIFTPNPTFDNPVPSAGAERPQKAVDILRTAWAQRQTCDLYIEGDLYSPANLGVTWSTDQTDAITVKLQVKEFTIVQSATVKVTNPFKKNSNKKKKALTPEAKIKAKAKEDTLGYMAKFKESTGVDLSVGFKF